MIYYFSATGNSKFVAESLARSLNDHAKSIEDEISETVGKVLELQNEKRIGFVTPTYRFVIPTILEKFLNEYTILSNESCYFFSVATYGTTPGVAAEEIKHILGKYNKNVSGMFSVRMPDNWTPSNDVSDKEKVKKLVDGSKVEIKKLATRIKNKETSKAKGALPYFLKNIGKSWYDKTRKTSNYYVMDSCIKCKKCINDCPDNAIRLVDDKITWIKDKCIMCSKCLHHCPTFSIQIKKSKSIKHGQYDHKMYE